MFDFNFVLSVVFFLFAIFATILLGVTDFTTLQAVLWNGKKKQNYATCKDLIWMNRIGWILAFFLIINDFFPLLG